MEQPTKQEQKLLNANHKNWLALPNTQGLVLRLEDWSRVPPCKARTVDEIEVWKTRALISSGFQELLGFITAPPYPGADVPEPANVFDFNESDEEEI